MPGAPVLPAELEVALASLLQASLPGLFGGATPVVRLTVATDATEILAREAEAVVGDPRGDPRPADQVDELPFDRTKPAGPYTLSLAPYPGPRRVRLVSPGGVTPLGDAEVEWGQVDPRKLILHPSAGRDLSTVTGVEVLYGVTAVFATVATRRTFGLSLDAQPANTSRLAGAVALALSVIELNREALTAAASVTYGGGDYGASSTIKRLRMVGVTAPKSTTRLLTLQADATLTLKRALREFEGAPIEHIRTPGRAPGGGPVEIDIGLGG
jgi:hypothetical protein